MLYTLVSKYGANPNATVSTLHIGIFLFTIIKCTGSG